jgi:hypothetical protein
MGADPEGRVATSPAPRAGSGLRSPPSSSRAGHRVARGRGRPAAFVGHRAARPGPRHLDLRRAQRGRASGRAPAASARSPARHGAPIARVKRILRAREATAVPVPSVLAFTGKTAPEAGLRRRGGWPTASGRRCRRGRGSRWFTAIYLRNLLFARDGSRCSTGSSPPSVTPLADLRSLLTEAGEPGPAVFAASALAGFPSRTELSRRTCETPGTRRRPCSSGTR